MELKNSKNNFHLSEKFSISVLYCFLNVIELLLYIFLKVIKILRTISLSFLLVVYVFEFLLGPTTRKLCPFDGVVSCLFTDFRKEKRRSLERGGKQREKRGEDKRGKERK
jgi:hypothetical protein